MKEVKMPPLDGTHFIVVYEYDGEIQSDKVSILDNKPFVYTHCGWLPYGDTPHWDDDLDARYFIAE